MKKITEDILYIGVNDTEIDLFEGQYSVPNGITYNSYVILDERVAVMDTVDAKFTDEWLALLGEALDGKAPDYLVVQHMEPDHSANISAFLRAYPDTAVVANAKTFTMIDNFYGSELCRNKITVTNGDTLSLGRHTLSFVLAPMVHWPEVMVTYDSTDKVLFSADAFGKFGTQSDAEAWDDEARRYYIGIVGKYGVQVQALLKNAAGLDIEIICPLHGPVLTDNLPHYIGKYSLWSSYEPEQDGVVIAYTSVYGNTKRAVALLADSLKANGCENVTVHDLARADMSAAVADAFRYSKLVLATTTYNGSIFPFMKQYIDALTERNFQKRTVAFIENGSWAPLAARLMTGMLEKSKQLEYAGTTETIKTCPGEENRAQIEALAHDLCD